MSDAPTMDHVVEELAYLVGFEVGQAFRRRLIQRAPVGEVRRGPPPVGQPTLGARVVSLVTRSRRPWTAGEVAAELGLGTHAAHVHLTRAVVAGRLRRVQRGRYAA